MGIEDQEEPAAEVTVCICTFRRSSVAAAIASVATQSVPPPPIVVVDNDETPSARATVEAAAAASGVDLRYVHAPARNISRARNAALDATATRWAALIDDDEVAAPGWLAALMAERHGHAAVIGPAIALYPEQAPAWLRRCDFHSNRISGDPANAYTANALLDLALVRRLGLRFDEAYGQTGGEDTLFFRALARAGGRIHYCPDAEVHEEVPPARATMRWVLRRRFRSGQTHGRQLSLFSPRAYRLLPATALAKAAVAALVAAVLWPVDCRWRRWAARAALHLGALHFTLTASIHREYA
ncbi:glycosyltransferase family 2 protein [Phaeospirillum tilakii]|uniref:Glycosyltransferase family 2 protein n=1 Tax=Phaeospirillum tilakii TaxID=741673 RepID=A0ABW5CC66_9PROT